MTEEARATADEEFEKGLHVIVEAARLANIVLHFGDKDLEAGIEFARAATGAEPVTTLGFAHDALLTLLDIVTRARNRLLVAGEPTDGRKAN